MRKNIILFSVIFACVIIGIVDGIIQPGYIIKSLIKIVLFLLIPVIYYGFSKDSANYLKVNKKGIIIAISFGLVIYVVIIVAYLIFKNIFDFSALTKSLGETTGVNKSNFIWVSIYISFVNSFLEEFFFRGFAFLTLKNLSSRRFAYIFSGAVFALYHISMMIGWFGLPVILIVVAGLFAGGLIFNRFDEVYDNIYISWQVHMFANFAINTIGFILFQ
ncbi:MAG: CPBP family intramembrane metalloprotease [Clostridia bacterium]|nr:CPBP family intramembrane metalloprotease [Clostridia bacterium]